ncbi:MAG: hypothetical protein ABI845_01540, partial [Polaromonas sp.]
MRGVKAVGLGCGYWRGAVFRALAATVIAAATALTATFTAFTAAVIAFLAFTTTLAACDWLAFSFTDSVLRRAFLARGGAVAHRSGHGRLIGQCQILLYRVARNALAAFWSLGTVAAALAVALATAFTDLIFAARLRFASLVAAVVGADLAGLAFLAATFGASFGIAFT